MLKKSLMFLSIVLLLGTLLIGCSNPAAGEAGPPGKDGQSNTGGGATGDTSTGNPVTISTGMSSEVIQEAINTTSSVTFMTGAEQNDAGTIIIPAGKKITFIGTSALILKSAGILIIHPDAILDGSGKIVTTGATVIAEAEIFNGFTDKAGTNVVPQTGNSIDLTENIIAVQGNTTIGTGAAIDPATSLSGKTIYVMGDLTVSNAVAAITGVIVTGKATVSATFAGAITAGGDVEATAAITGDVTLGGNITGTGSIVGDVTATADTDISVPITGGITATGHKVAFKTGAETTGITTLTAGSVDSSVDITINAIVVSGEIKITENTLTAGAKPTTVGSLNLTGGTFDLATYGVDITGAATIGGTLETTGDITAASLSVAVTGSVSGADVTINGGADIAGTLTATGDVAVDEDINVTGSGTINMTGTSKSLTIALGAVLNIEDVTASVVLDGTNETSLVLTKGSSNDGAKITGAGTLTAGKTEIIGGTDGWQANDTTNTTIASLTADTASITGGVLKALGVGATITQSAGSGNKLTIGAATTIALGGDGIAVGSIVLKGASSNPGTLTFGNAGSGVVGTSLITTGATSAANPVTGTISDPATGVALKWKAENGTTGGKWSEVGAATGNVDFVGDDPDDVTLSGATTVTAS